MSFKKYNKIRKVLLAILPGILVAALVFGANVYYDLDLGKVIIQEITKIIGMFETTATTTLATSGAYVGIGTSTLPSYTLDVSGALRLMPYSQPTGANGVVYYDLTANRFKCYQNGAWVNCVGEGGSVGGSGTQNYLAKWTATTTLGNSIVLDNGSLVSVLGQFTTQSTTTLATSTGYVGIGTATPSEKLTVYGNILGSGNILLQSGSYNLTLTPAALSSNRTITFPDLSGTVAVSSTSPITLSSTGVIGLTTPLAISFGGTATTSIGSAGSVVYSNGTTYAFTSVGTAGQPLLSGGSGAPTWGTLSVSYGGTGLTSVASGALLFGSGGTALNTLSIGSANTILASNGSAPYWSSLSSLSIPTGTGAANYITKWTGANTLATSTITDDGSIVNIPGTTTLATASGRVGIGTSSPAYLLDVYSAGGNTIRLGASSTDTVLVGGGSGKLTVGVVDPWLIQNTSLATTTLYIRTSSTTGADDIVFQTAGTNERMRILENGNVGIGTTAPAYTLDVNGTLRVSATSTFSARVGIRTTAPSAALEIVGENAAAGSDAPLALKIVGGTGGSSTGLAGKGGNIELTAGTGGAGTGSYGFGGAGGDIILTGGSGGSAYQQEGGSGGAIKLQGGSGYYDYGYVLLNPSGGNVGIGTTVPSAKLHVLGTTEQLRLGYNTSNAVKFTVGSTNALTITPLVNNTSGFNFTNAAGTSILNIDTSNQRVGIGTTTPVYLLDVYSAGGNTIRLGASSTDTVLIGGGEGKLTVGVVDPWLIQNTSLATTTLYIRTSSTTGADDIVFQTAGTNERLRILENGYVGIGTSTPATTFQVYGTSTFMGGNVGIGTSAPSYKLDVSGDIRSNVIFSEIPANYYALGSNILIRDDTAVYTSNTTPTKAKEFYLTKLFPKTTTLRIYFELQGLSFRDPETREYYYYYGYAQIYKNGSPYGTQRSKLGVNYVSFTEDLTFSEGDYVQLYYWTETDGEAFVRNFRILGAPVNQFTDLFGRIKASDGEYPGFYFGAGDGSFDTSILRPGANILTFSTAGTERIRIDSAGNIGIRTTSPGSTLTVSGGSYFQYLAAPSGVTASAASGGTLAAGTYYYVVVAYDSTGLSSAKSTEVSCTVDGSTTTACQISWSAVSGAASYKVYGRASGAQNQYWSTTATSYTDTGTTGISGTPPSSPTSAYFAGNVGIGTTAPSYTLDVSGTLRATATTTLATAGGNVGIGTTAPVSLLEVYSSIADSKLTITAATSTDSMIVFRTGATPATQAIIGIDYSDSNKLKLVRGSDIATSTGITIDSSGNVGIGTTAPAYKLDVVGDINVSGAIRENGVAIRPPLTWFTSTTTVQSTASTAFTSYPLSLSFNLPTQRKVVFIFSGSDQYNASDNYRTYFRLMVDSTERGQCSMAVDDLNYDRGSCTIVWVGTLSAGSHTASMEWKTEGGTTYVPYTSGVIVSLTALATENPHFDEGEVKENQLIQNNTEEKVTLSQEEALNILRENFSLKGSQGNYYLFADPSISSGDLVSFSKDIPLLINKADPSSRNRILGVVSGELGLHDFRISKEKIADLPFARVIFAGRAEVKVSNENGAIKIGDLLTVGSTPGVAAKATEPGRVIGMALESSEKCTQEELENKKCKIMVFVNPHWSLGSLTEDGNLTANNETTSSEQRTILDQFTLAIKNSLKKLGLIIENGIAQIKEIITEKLSAKVVVTNQLCLGQTCIDEAKLKELLEKTGTIGTTNNQTTNNQTTNNQTTNNGAASNGTTSSEQLSSEQSSTTESSTNSSSTSTATSTEETSQEISTSTNEQLSSEQSSSEQSSSEQLNSEQLSNLNGAGSDSAQTPAPNQ